MKQSFEMDTLLGLANLLADNEMAEVPLWSELDADGQPNAPQPVGTIAIYVDRYPEGLDSVTLADYTVDDDPSLSEQTIGVQVTIKARDLDAVKAVGSDIYALIHGRWGGMLGRVRLVSARRASGTSVGQDSSDRQGRQENYYLRVHRPSPNRQ